MEEQEVAALAEQAKAGDVSAFERLYSCHTSSILFHVRSLLIDKEAYIDVAQNVALKMFEDIHTLREPAAFRGWMHQIVRSACALHNRQHLKQTKRMSFTEDDEALEAIIDEEADPETQTMAGLEGNWLFARISELPLSYREIITLFYYDEMSYKEIAEVLDISVSNVSARLKRAMEALRSKAGDMGEASDATDRMHDRASKVLDKAKMKEEPTHTTYTEDDLTVTTDPKLKEKGLEDDIGVKNSLVAAVAVVASEDTSALLVNSVHAKLIAATGTTVAASTAGAAVAAGKGVTLAGCLISSVVLAVALGFGGLAVYQEYGDATLGGFATQTQDLQYQGTLHVVFANASGVETDHNIVMAQVTEEGSESVLTTWEIYKISDDAQATEGEAENLIVGDAGVFEMPEGATLLQSGTGNSIDSSVLSVLESGLYQVVFSLEDSRGANAQIARSFIITE